MADVKHFDEAAVLGVVVQLFWRQGLATTGIRDVVTATGVNRSSLYSTFGDKRQLYLAALDRYLDDNALPGFARLADDPRGLPAITQFFEQLIRARCSGERARWGCLMVNAHTGAESSDPDVQRRLHRHYEHLRAAMRDALGTAHRLGQLRSGADIENTAGQLALLAYGVNLRSRAGAPSAELNSTVHYTLSALTTP
ncbi:TetR/AcrR family transcriptional regulator [Amycolatopsis sp. NBC_01488]|uniref:TetR/AcrR family transcriptional regulator n=1 Tax=Amycolatopsis sp. NBC_01488 TaxID=2903563 RepID=UPI002E27F933|nr:TetR/AcrR family transcriptional regulator [Amycolatopsis sp. NBC_01488]